MVLVTETEKDNGIFIKWNTILTVKQLIDIKTSTFFPRCAELLDTHCNEANNFASCCPGRGSRYCDHLIIFSLNSKKNSTVNIHDRNKNAFQ